MFGAKKECDWVGCKKQIDAYGPMYCRRHQDARISEMWSEQVDQATFLQRWKDSGADQVWMQATSWLITRAGWEKKLGDRSISAEDREWLEVAVRTFTPVFELSEEIKRSDQDIERTLALGQQMDLVVEALKAAKAARDAGGDSSTSDAGAGRTAAVSNPLRRTSNESGGSPSWAALEPDQATQNSRHLVIRYLEANRRRDYDAIIAMVGTHDGALMAGLIKCAGAVIPVFRETVADDQEYLEVLDEFTRDEIGLEDFIRGTAVQILNSQGGVDAPGRWTGPETVQMTADMVRDVNFAMAVTLNGLINITASMNDADEEESFRRFVDLIRDEAA